MHEKKVKHAHLTQKGESEVMRGRGSMLTEVNIVLMQYFLFSHSTGPDAVNSKSFVSKVVCLWIK